MTDEELARDLYETFRAAIDDSLRWEELRPESRAAAVAQARRAKELLGMTDAERELIEAALEHTDTTIALPLRLVAAAAKVRSERKPKLRYYFGCQTSNGFDVFDRENDVPGTVKIVATCPTTEAAKAVLDALNSQSPK